MKHVSSTELRANLSKMMDQVNDDHEPLIITRAGGKPAVMISLEDFEALDETAYLLSSPANARALRDAITSLDAGQGIGKTIGELADPASE